MSIALNTNEAVANSYYTVTDSFFVSDRKRFHDATKEHLNFVMNILLPNQGVVS